MVSTSSQLKRAYDLDQTYGWARRQRTQLYNQPPAYYLVLP